MRLMPCLACALALAGCAGTGPDRRDVLASATPVMDPASPAADALVRHYGSGVSIRADLKTPEPQPRKELTTVDITVNRQTGQGNRELAAILLADDWHFWKKVNHGDGTVTWTFARPKYPGVDLRTLIPDPGKPRTR